MNVEPSARAIPAIPGEPPCEAGYVPAAGDVSATGHVTVRDRTQGGWACVDDAGHRVTLPDEALDPALRGLRVGQRLAVRTAGGRLVAGLP